MDYNFLNNLTLIDTGRTRTPKTKNPTGLTIRIFNDGSVYPSQEAVDKFNLQYLGKEANTNSFGFDVIDSAQWKVFENAPRVIVVGLTTKNQPKVELFASCKFNENGTPKADVMTQGSLSTTLLDLVKDLKYITEDQKYVDLRIVEEHPIKMEDGLAYIPKVFERGVKKGEKDYVKRENSTFYILEPQEMEVNNTVETTNELVTTN